MGELAEAEQRFAALRIRYQAGGLGNAAYEAKLHKLVVEDGAGGYWMLGADSRGGTGMTESSGCGRRFVPTVTVE